MTLNASGTLSLAGSTVGQSFDLELGQAATATISLNDTNVRTLLGVASGIISMSSGYGKSNFSWSRPTTWSCTYSATGTPANAYDTAAGKAVDTATSTGASTALGSVITYSAFSGSGTVTAQLHIRAAYGVQYNGTVTGTDPITTYQVSTDGGSTWSTAVAITSAQVIYLYSLTAVTLSLVQVRFSCGSSSGGNVKLGTDWNNTAYLLCTDIVIY